MVNKHKTHGKIEQCPKPSTLDAIVYLLKHLYEHVTFVSCWTQNRAFAAISRWAASLCLNITDMVRAEDHIITSACFLCVTLRSCQGFSSTLGECACMRYDATTKPCTTKPYVRTHNVEKSPLGPLPQILAHETLQETPACSWSFFVTRFKSLVPHKLRNWNEASDHCRSGGANRRNSSNRCINKNGNSYCSRNRSI